MERDEKYPNGIHPGEIAVTSGHELNCTKIYHGSLPVWDKDKTYKSKKVNFLPFKTNGYYDKLNTLLHNKILLWSKTKTAAGNKFSLDLEG